MNVSGLRVDSDFLSETEEAELLSQIDQGEWNTSISRRTQHYGYEYNYTNPNVLNEADPIPDWVTFVLDRLIEREYLKMKPNQLIINEYIPGQGIGPHTDHVKHFADGIVSITLGSAVFMDFTLGNAKESVCLERRSILCMTGEARYRWKHSIAARKVDPSPVGKRGRRVSMTFRYCKVSSGLKRLKSY